MNFRHSVQLRFCRTLIVRLQYLVLHNQNNSILNPWFSCYSISLRRCRYLLVKSKGASTTSARTLCVQDFLYSELWRQNRTWSLLSGRCELSDQENSRKYMVKKVSENVNWKGERCGDFLRAGEWSPHFQSSPSSLAFHTKITRCGAPDAQRKCGGAGERVRNAAEKKRPNIGLKTPLSVDFWTSNRPPYQLVRHGVVLYCPKIM